MKIVITGAAGLLGTHLQYYLESIEGYKSAVIALDRNKFNDDASLRDALVAADVVIHCAGINRDEEAVLENGNRALAERLVEMLDRMGTAPHLLYANTIQRGSDSAYGRGKAAASEVFGAWATRAEAAYSDLVLPHIFGEGGRPYYNSVVLTFCDQLAKGEPLSINGSGQLELIHAQDVAVAFVDHFERGLTGERRILGVSISVAETAGKLIAMHGSYTKGIIPNLDDRLDLQLFNTLRSFLYPDFYPRELTLHTDERGSLFEAVKSRNGGQSFLSTTKPGITRGNHYHFHKVERFLVISGEAVIRIRRLMDDHVESFTVSGDRPVFVDMPTFHTHSITNIGKDDLLTLFWSHELFDPEHPDTYFEPVLDDKE
ncbi:polysaccharide biosynthesis C-terminal domain-containing protein [Halomonas sp. RA08-2]|uniref:polysaccharide biosynthesis C-terminal domain-containing protein n=1 Tax=Halomonas sp. RA08-2 TaxID=3440842 RepID=UPI003EEF0072